jgi:aminoglycoside phosphotransferase (APT) family kinase protein
VREWSAEVALDAALVRRLLAQFPELELRSLRLLAEGWDNSVWVVDERWAFRFPRRTVAIPGVEREIEVLPQLAGLLPLPIPVPRFVGRPADGYPWPFYGGPLLPGREVADAALSDGARRRLARPLATFLRALHSAEIPAELPEDPMSRGDMTLRVPRTLDRLAEVAQLGLWRAPAPIGRLLEEARALPAPEPTAVAHGDLHFRHVLVDDDGAPSGVIDWGDVCRADPAIDLLLLWCLPPADGRAEFLDAYGTVSDEQLLRARVLAFFLCAVLAVYAHHEGMRAVEREAVEGLWRASEE